MTTSTPLISIVVPAYNAGRYLPELCSSIQAQTIGNFEVLIGDDGSADDTQQVLAPFATDPRFRVIHLGSNRGVGRATYILLSLARGEYWCNPGADDVLNPDFLERRLRVLEANPGAIMGHGPARLIDEESEPLRDFPGSAAQVELQQRTPLCLSADRAISVLLQHNFVNAPSTMVRMSLSRPVLPQFVSGWSYCQDWSYWVHLLATGSDMLWDPVPVSAYRIHPQSLTQGPKTAAVRLAETRLVPFCTLSTLSAHSPICAVLWTRWRTPLYHLWLRRAWTLWKNHALDPQWLQIGARAYYGLNCSTVSLLTEVVRHGVGLICTSLREAQMRRNQIFHTNGLAQIDDPLFRKENN